MEPSLLWKPRRYLKQVVIFVILLLCVQILRAFLIYRMWAFWQPAPDSILWATMDMVAFGLVGLGLWLAFKPSLSGLGLTWKDAPWYEKASYLFFGSLVLILTVSTYWFSPETLVTNISAVLVLPLFEELLFRGWGWGRLEKAYSGRWSGTIHWLVISLLFGLWHFGYMDIYLLKVAPLNPDYNWTRFFVMKFLTTFVIGLVVGFQRQWSGRVYGSLLLHAAINLFGR